MKHTFVIKCILLLEQFETFFFFLKGTLAKAVKKGYWILLDEINLAAAETLECLSGLLESSAGSLVLLDRGDLGKLVFWSDT